MSSHKRKGASPWRDAVVLRHSLLCLVSGGTRVSEALAGCWCEAQHVSPPDACNTNSYASAGSAPPPATALRLQWLRARECALR